MAFSASELILNADGSIYHLNLLPEDIANTIITVGDPDRVDDVSSFFDGIELKKGKREFRTHTGTLNGKRISVVSTGIGTDNIDIVMNELDALVNIDFQERSIKKIKTPLNIIRIGTSGAIQSDIPVDSFLLSRSAIGLDGLLHFYESDAIQDTQLSNSLKGHLSGLTGRLSPYAVSCDIDLAQRFTSEMIIQGITVTGTGFYAPQGRSLRLLARDPSLMAKLKSFRYGDRRLTNLEMETSGIYGLTKLLGHRAVSLNAILANRSTGEFSKNSQKTVHNLIKYALNGLTK